MQKLELSYAVWTLLGEPVEDYLFRWDFSPMSALTGTSLKPEEMRGRSPELYEALKKIAPLKVFLRATVSFLKEGQTTPFAFAKIDMSPDLPEGAGQWQKLSVPGSPDGDDFMFEVKDQGLCAPDEKSQQNGAACLKKVWKASARVQLTELELLHVEWPDVAVKQVVDAYNAREASRGSQRAAGSKTTPDAAQKSWMESMRGDDAGAVGGAGSSSTATDGRSPFRMPRSSFAGTKRKLDGAAKKKRQEKAKSGGTASSTQFDPIGGVSCSWRAYADRADASKITVSQRVRPDGSYPPMGMRIGTARAGAKHNEAPDDHRGTWVNTLGDIHLRDETRWTSCDRRRNSLSGSSVERSSSACGGLETDIVELSFDCAVGTTPGPKPLYFSPAPLSDCKNVYRYRITNPFETGASGPCMMTFLSGPTKPAPPSAPSASAPKATERPPPLVLKTDGAERREADVKRAEQAQGDVERRRAETARQEAELRAAAESTKQGREQALRAECARCNGKACSQCACGTCEGITCPKTDPAVRGAGCAK
jgi:hypothetical protein